MSICVFTGGLYPAPEQTRRIFSTAGLPDYVIAADSGLYAAETYQSLYHFEINCITGDMDSLDPPDALSRYPSSIIDRHPQDKDDTDTEIALRKAALRRGGKTSDISSARNPIILIGGDGGRLDHTLAIMRLFGSPNAPDIWLCTAQAVYAVGEGHGKSLEVSGLTGSDPISIFSSVTGKIRCDGLFWDIANLKWDEGAYSLSNKVARSHEGKPLCFEADSGVFLVIVPLYVLVRSVQ